MPAIHLRTDVPLHSQLTEIARAEGLSLNSYLVRLVRSDISRRQRYAAAVGRDWRATDAELADALATDLAKPLSDVDQRNLKGLTPEQAVGFAVARVRKASSNKSAPSATNPRQASSSKPPTAPSSQPAPVTRTPAAKPRPAKQLVTADEYDDLLALRAKRAGKRAPARGSTKGLPALVSAREFDELMASRKRGGK
jgi:hypothetical protein